MSNATPTVCKRPPAIPSKTISTSGSARPTFNRWIAYTRHTGSANYLYVDGHVVTMTWDEAVGDLFPDHVILTVDSSYPF